MNTIFNKILTLFKHKDEICGEWVTDDGSGFSMIMGSWIKFNSNGTGEYESWSNSPGDLGYNYDGDFLWSRIDNNKIEIILLPEKTKEIIAYKLQKVNNRIELSNLEKKKNELDGFWNFAQIMFKN